ncbi:MAG: GNAT family N-acetyltransferase [Caulobacteraceae bacterium]|nr:MAG: GNAT family N-acetyltransferase [Caulobacteraceae bacterium]
MVRIAPITPDQLPALTLALCDILIETVGLGASVGFLAPLSLDEARAFWSGICQALARGDRLMWGAWADEALVGTVQIVVGMPGNQQHRVDLVKLMTLPSARGGGIGAALTLAAEAEAARRGKTLVVLDTVAGNPAQRLYERLGYEAAGVIPDYARSSAGPLEATCLMYKRLG